MSVPEVFEWDYLKTIRVVGEEKGRGRKRKGGGGGSQDGLKTTQESIRKRREQRTLRRGKKTLTGQERVGVVLKDPVRGVCRQWRKGTIPVDVRRVRPSYKLKRNIERGNSFTYTSSTLTQYIQEDFQSSIICENKVNDSTVSDLTPFFSISEATVTDKGGRPLHAFG